TGPNFRKLPFASHLSLEHTSSHLSDLEHYQHARSAEWNHGRVRLHNISSTPHRSPHYSPSAERCIPICVPALLSTGLLLLQWIPVQSLRGKCGTTVVSCCASS